MASADHAPHRLPTPSSEITIISDLSEASCQSNADQRGTNRNRLPSPLQPAGNDIAEFPPSPDSRLLLNTDLESSSPTLQHSSQQVSLEELVTTDAPVAPPKKPSRGTKICGNAGGWWWEISAMVLCSICTIMLFVFLLKINKMRLESWKLKIQPNTIIAVLTTISKSAMMVPVASCISQLKWHHFLHQNDKLEVLQLFDDASRGPWGSALLLFMMRKRALLGWSLAVVTIVGLGIDPSAQQILDFPTRTATLTNVTANLGYATNYISKGYQEGTLTNTIVPNNDLLKLQAAILNGISGDVFQPNMDCPAPATSCVWDNITTLGICSTFQNVTDIAKRNCTGNIRISTNCTYDFSGRDAFNKPVNMTYNTQGTSNAPDSDLFRSIATLGLEDSMRYLALVVVKAEDTVKGSSDIPRAEVYQAKWFWCARTFTNIAASARGLDRNVGEFEKLSYVSTNEDGGDFESDHMYQTWAANSTGTEFNVSSSTDLSLWAYLARFLTRDVVYRSLPTKEEGELDVGTFLYTADLRNVTSNMATTLTNQIRSNSPGDNTEAATTKGSATIREAYIHVRWGWFILPMAENVLAALLLISVIMVTLGEPLLKESVVSYIACNCDADLRGALNSSLPATSDEMSNVAGKVVVKLTKLPGEPFYFELVKDSATLVNQASFTRVR